jgi:hypothetical protein
MNIIAFTAGTDIAVIDQNPEMADMDNPAGFIYGYTAFVYAEDEHGYRKRLCVGATRFEEDILPKAKALASALTNRLNNLGKDPLNFEQWEDTFPAYGSAAYCANPHLFWPETENLV